MTSTRRTRESTRVDTSGHSGIVLRHHVPAPSSGFVPRRGALALRPGDCGPPSCAGGPLRGGYCLRLAQGGADELLTGRNGEAVRKSKSLKHRFLKYKSQVLSSSMVADSKRLEWSREERSAHAGVHTCELGRAPGAVPPAGGGNGSRATADGALSRDLPLIRWRCRVASRSSPVRRFP